MRVETEAHFKQTLKKFKQNKDSDGEYKPVNYYGHFLKDQIDKKASSNEKIIIN